MEFLIPIVVRISVLLCVGWLALLISRKANPRWTVFISRALMIAIVGVPIIALSGPTWDVPLLPAEFEGNDTASGEKPGDDDVANERSTRLIATDEEAATPTTVADSTIAETDQTPKKQRSDVAVTNGVLSADNEILHSSSRSASELTESLSVAKSDRNTHQSETPTVQLGSSKHVHNTDRSENSASIPPASSGVMTTGAWLLVAWLAGMISLLARLINSMLRTVRLINESSDAPESVQRFSGHVPVRLSGNVNGPCSAGWLHPVILLPAQWAAEATESDLQTVIAHEAAHVKGYDAFWDLVARVLCAVLWFHPLMWRLPRTHQLACEHLCDATAASISGGPSAYRQLLAAWALQFNETQRKTTVSALSMADRSLLHQRLAWLTVDRATPHLKGRGKLYVATGALFALFLTATVSFIPSAAVVAGDDPVKQVALADTGTVATIAAAQPPVVGKQPKPAAKEFRLRIVDENEQPVPTAEVAITGWKSGDGKSYGVAIQYLPVEKSGEITLKFDAKAVEGRVSVRAKGFSDFSQNYTLTGSPTIKLKRGRVVKVRAVDTNGKLMDDAIPILEESRIWGREFKSDGNGNIVSPAVDMTRQWMRVVGVSDDDVLLFSDLIDVTNEDAADDDGVIQTILKPGVTFRGKLDDSVPRPIKNGVVELCIAESKNHRIPGAKEDLLPDSPGTGGRPAYKRNGFRWQETIPVNEDGTFEFESLPPGGFAQVFVLVDGFQSRLPSMAELREYLAENNAGGELSLEVAESRSDPIHAQIFSLRDAGDDGVLSATIPCMPTTDLRVKVVSPAGDPIVGATVNLNPNGLFLAGGLFIPGTEINTAAMVRDRNFFDRNKAIATWIRSSLLNVVTGDDGVAVVNMPGVGSEGFDVSADGYVMPVHPLSSADRPSRYASVELAPGETLRRTITMEREINLIEREVLVVDSKGKPLPKIKVTALEVGFADAPEDWESWSVQRFGPIASATTTSDGKAVIRLPKQIDRKLVAQYRISVQGMVDRKKEHGFRNADGKLTRDASLRSRLNLPLKDDGYVVAVSISETPPRENNAFWKATAEYIDPIHLTPASGEDLIKQLVERPSLVMLKQLLQINGYDASVPLEFRSEWVLIGPHNAKKSPVNVISSGDHERVVILCRVRPRDATWTTKPEGRYAPEAAFIFDPSDGKLVTTVGGGQSSSGSYENVMLVNLGGGDDYFLSVKRWEKREVNKQGSRWYRVENAENGPSLSIQHDANGNPWSGKPGPSDPPAEFGYLEYVSMGKGLEGHVPGLTANGVPVPRQVYWDIARNQFYGPVTQTVDGKSIYRIDASASKEFTAVDRKATDILAAGGRGEYQNWHMWWITTPATGSFTLRLRETTSFGDLTETKTLSDIPLPSGALHGIQFQIDPEQQTEETSVAHLRTNIANLKDKNEKLEFTVSKQLINDTPSVKDARVMQSDSKSVVLWKKTNAVAAGKNVTLELAVEAVAESGGK